MKCKKTDRAPFYCNPLFWVLFVLLVLIFPFVIEKILYAEKIWPFCIDIVFSRELWFGFLGSYFGVICTAILGIIALKQNDTLSAANKELTKLQEDFYVNLTNPILRLSEDISFDYKDSTKDVGKMITDNISTRYPLVYDKIAKSYKDEPRWYTTMKLTIENCSEIPLTHFKIASMTWTIGDVSYVFVGNITQGKSRTTFIQKYNVISMCIIYPDMTNQNPALAQCGSAIQLLIEPPDLQSIVTKSKMCFDVSVTNQANRQRTFTVEMEMVKTGSMQMKVAEYMIFSKEDTTNDNT